MIRSDVLEALQNSVSSSSKLFVLTFAEKNGKAWAMVKTKAKTRAMPKKEDSMKSQAQKMIYFLPQRRELGWTRKRRKRKELGKGTI